jgi:hypothetical protein
MRTYAKGVKGGEQIPSNLLGRLQQAVYGATFEKEE